MRKIDLFAASALAMIAAMPMGAAAQATPDAQNTGTTNSSDSGYGQDIVITAQRQAQTLQEVPIAVSAFSAETLQEQQIDNASDLQLTLPNVTFSKGNFTGSSFTIRGVGDLCVGISCDAATAIHINGTPLLATRIFETEYFDLERVEVLRGPQGTLFGRSATSGVINFISAKPRTDAFSASGDVEYGNYDSIRARGVVNVPLGDTMAVRLAGFYLNRDGYTKNLYDNTTMDGRDMYAIRGSFRWEPSVDTTFDLMGYYFREDDDRLRIQKQQCQRDPTGTMGCLNGRLDAARSNTNAGFTGTLGSREFLGLTFGAGLAGLGLNSLYGADAYAGYVDSPDVREVASVTKPTYFTDELQVQARLEHNFGPLKAQLTGMYHETSVESSQDYTLGVGNSAGIVTGLSTLAALANAPGFGPYFTPVVNALIPNGVGSDLCTSLPEETGLGSFGGFKRCASTPLAFDRSTQRTKAWSAEAIISSDFDGAFNFLLGGIYVNNKLKDGDYYVNAFPIDYLSGVLGAVQSFAGGLPPSFSGTPFFRNATPEFELKSYGIFGEAYFAVNDRVQLTLGLRYNNDKKSLVARSTLASFLVPHGQAGTAFDSPFYSGYDADPAVAGIQPLQIRNRGFDAFTGRAVLDFKITDDNLLYASYSRGYKSGGFNPAVQVPGLTIPDAFQPESIDAFEIGSKNNFGNGKLTLNLTAFYYKYKNLQLSRIVARSSINDNINANIWGVEAEAVIRPARDWAINFGASYLNTSVQEDGAFINQRDPSGGDRNSVIIKDIGGAFNCVVQGPTAAAAEAFVSSANSAINAGAGLDATTGLRGPAPFPTDANLGAPTGAFSLCSALTGFANPDSPLGLNPANLIKVVDGVGVSIKGNSLPQAPVAKFSAGVQKTFEFTNGMTLVPRVDLTYTGESYGNIFNGRVNRIEGYEQANAQIQLNGTDDRWFVRGFIQNIFDNNATTGLYLTDQSSGLFTNIFTLEPRRYGVGAGFKF